MDTTQNIKEQSLEVAMQDSFLEYARFVIEDRALPDARDGLKPVHRRVLYAMNELGLDPNKAYKKSARIVGDVIGKYHPHGDSAVYETIVRLAQDFSSRYPMVDGHGNFGSIDGDSAAAMRYTEARMSQYAMLMLEDLEHTVDFEPNFDDSLKEPSVLPSKIPNVLLNGTSGIAVGMSTNIAPHHGKEVLKALISMLKNDKTDIARIIKGPDFPTGGVYVNPQGWRNIVKTGKGSVTIRAKYHIEEVKNKKLLVFTDVPYMVKKTKVIEKIVELADSIQGINDIREESGRDGIRVVVEVKNGVDENYVLHELLKRTPLQTNFGIQNQVLIDGKPVVASYKEILETFTKHRLDMIERKLNHDLAVEEAKLHLLEGQVKVLSDVDQAVAIIKKSKDRDAAKKALMKAFDLSEKQADSVLALRLQKLTGLELKDLKTAVKNSKTIIKGLQAKLKDLTGTLLAEWEELLKVMKDPRRTDIEEAETLEFEKPNNNEDVVVVVTETDMARQSVRSGEKDGINIQTNTGETLYGLGESGLLHPIKVKELPDITGGKGKPLNLPEPMLWIGKIEDAPGVYSFTKDGKGKAVKVQASKRPTVVSQTFDCLVVSDNPHLLLLTREGMAIRFEASELPTQGKGAGGVKAIALSDDDELFAVFAVEDSTKVQMEPVTGKPKTSAAKNVSLTKRGGKGVKSFAPKGILKSATLA